MIIYGRVVQEWILHISRLNEQEVLCGIDGSETFNRILPKSSFRNSRNASHGVRGADPA